MRRKRPQRTSKSQPKAKSRWVEESDDSADTSTETNTEVDYGESDELDNAVTTSAELETEESDEPEEKTGEIEEPEEIEEPGEEESGAGSESESYQSGGEHLADEEPDDEDHLDIDPDDENKKDENDEYDPVTGTDVLEDEDTPDTETTTDKREGAETETDTGDNADNEGEVGDDDVDAIVPTKTCYAKNLDQDMLPLDEDDQNVYGKMKYTKVDDDKRETDPIMTYYELVRIIGTRAQQFNYGAAPLVSGLDGLHPAKMAYLEVLAKMTPYIIRRNLPGKRYEDWRVDELEIIHKITDEYFLPENFDHVTYLAQLAESVKAKKKK